MCSGSAACADSAADGNSKQHPEQQKEKKKKSGVLGASISFRVDPAADDLSSAKGRQEVSVSVNGLSGVTVTDT